MKKKITSLLLSALLLSGSVMSPVAGTAVESSDVSVSMWFDHVSKKTKQADTKSTSMSSYHMYMAKNEIEGC